jgi:hypothetical protein
VLRGGVDLGVMTIEDIETLLMEEVNHKQKDKQKA